MHAHLAHAHRLLHDLGQRVHQREPTTHPARRAIQSARELGLREGMSLAQLAQQPSFFEGRALAAVVESVREHQRLGLGHLEHRDIDEVARELEQRRDADVPVDQDPGRTVTHDQHRCLLTMLEQRRHQSSRSTPVGDPQLRVAQIQLAQLELHRLTTLGRPAPDRDAVSRRARGMSDEFSNDPKVLADHCVSHPVADHFAGFLNDYGQFWTHYVSHHLEAKFGRHRAPALRHGLSEATAEPIGFLLGRILAPPLRARLPVSLSLTRLVAAHTLTITSAWVWLKPATTDPARALAGHPAQRRASENSGSA